jgi:thiamine-phosphate pyrophosphorylase
MYVGERTRHQLAAKLTGLYVIIDPELTNGRDLLQVARQALEGGATAIQFRDKHRDKGDALPTAQRLLKICRDYDAVLIINDHADLAVACAAGGVHVGQHDLPIPMARAVLKPWQLVGSSNALEDEAIASYQDRADYIAVGAMFSTSSKVNTRPAGLATLKAVREIIPADGPPLIAIGGIDKLNVAEVAKAGADGIAVIGAVAMAEDPARAASELLNAFLSAKAGS